MRKRCQSQSCGSLLVNAYPLLALSTSHLRCPLESSIPPGTWLFPGFRLSRIESEQRRSIESASLHSAAIELAVLSFDIRLFR